MIEIKNPENGNSIQLYKYWVKLYIYANGMRDVRELGLRCCIDQINYDKVQAGLQQLQDQIFSRGVSTIQLTYAPDFGLSDSMTYDDFAKLESVSFCMNNVIGVEYSMEQLRPRQSEIPVNDEAVTDD